MAQRKAGRRRRTVLPGRALRMARHRVLPTQPFLLLILVALVLVVAVNSVRFPVWIPVTSVNVVLLIGGFWLRLRALVLQFAVTVAAVIWVAVRRTDTPVTPGAYATIAVTALLVLAYARGRERLGVQGTLGEAMLVDLRDRLRSQGEVPRLPARWNVETVLRSAYGDSFSGDFLVASRSTDDRWLELVMVDVSGKGQPAGTRALLLSGAFGGLLGATDRAEFLSAANSYLLRQRWDEGFATAVHLALDLDTGFYQLATAGHPPPAQYHAGSGRWQLLDAMGGPLLGVVEDAKFPVQDGRLNRGDALLMYTDGLVETPGRDLGLGIDWLMGQAERLVQRGFSGGAARIADGAKVRESDDRALVLLWRS